MSQDSRKLIRELIDEVLEEMTTTGAVQGYMTPNAFRGGKSKKASTERSIPGGKVVGPEDETDDTTIGESEGLMVKRQLEEGRSRYRNFKENDMMKNHAKVSYGINQAKKMLGEVEYLVDICDRLKTECGYSNDNLWKRTKPDMMEIHRRLKEIAKKIHRVGK